MKSDAYPQQAHHERDDEAVRAVGPQRLLIGTALAVLVCAAAVLLILSFVPPVPMLVKVLAGGMTTAALAVPFLYLFQLRPMRQQIAVRRRAEEELDSVSHRLKALVAERTESLAQTNRRLTHELEEHRRTADSLRQHNDFVEAVVAKAPCLVLTFDAETRRCGFAGNRTSDLLGYGPEELTADGATVGERLVDPGDRASFRNVVAELVNGPEGQIVGGSCGFVASSGRTVQLRYAMTVLSRTPTMEAKDILLTALPASP